jgi:methyltransferase (TIGR00027 family)
LNGAVTDEEQELTPVSRTAVGVARIRASESERAGRLFDDPYAARFVAAMPTAYDDTAQRTDAERTMAARLAVHVIIRTRFYDDYLLAAADAGIRQVVLVAAGLDTRAFRLDWPAGLRLFEIDLPPVLAFKDDVLRGERPRCDRVTVAADLTGDWPDALRAAGFGPTEPTAWLVEGLLVYLTSADTDRLLTDITRLAAPGCRIACERGGNVPPSDAGDAPAGVTALWQGGLEQDVDAWLAGHGWTAEVHGLADVAAGYGRPLRTETQSAFVTAILGPPGG